MPEIKDPNIIALPRVRLSFPCLFTPKALEEGKEPQFSATFLLDNERHADILDQIDTTIERVALDFFKKKVPLKKKCIHDGNEKSELEGYGDSTSFLVSSNKSRPAVVDRRKVPVVESDGLIYAGCYVNATVRIFAWEHKTGGRGVSAQLRAVQFVEDGESFGAGPVDADKEFDDLDTDGNGAPMGGNTRSRSSTGNGRSGAAKVNLDDF